MYTIGYIQSKKGQVLECKKCKSKMIEISRKRVMVEIDDDATEGQMADYMTAELSGDFGEWGVTEITYSCEKCGNIVVVMKD